MLNILREPYPLYKDIPKQLVLILGIGIFISCFLYVFEPFGLYDMERDTKLYYIIGFGILTFLVLSFTQIIVPFILPQIFNETIWTVGKQIYYLFAVAALGIGVAYQYYCWYNGIEVSHFLYFFKRTFALALFPIVGIILFDYIYKLKKYQRDSSELSQQLSDVPKSTEVKEIVLSGANKNESIELLTTNLLFLKSANNYVEVFYLKEGKIQREILRNSLSKIIAQISSDQFIQCHRSYFVNTQHIQKISGNAQGYKLHLNAYEEALIPVARSKGKELIQRLRMNSE